MRLQFYGYLNLESTKTVVTIFGFFVGFYGYLNLESTKTRKQTTSSERQFYGYLNLESTKTLLLAFMPIIGFTVT